MGACLLSPTVDKVLSSADIIAWMHWLLSPNLQGQDTQLVNGDLEGYTLRQKLF